MANCALSTSHPLIHSILTFEEAKASEFRYLAPGHPAEQGTDPRLVPRPTLRSPYCKTWSALSRIGAPFSKDWTRSRTQIPLCGNFKKAVEFGIKRHINLRAKKRMKTMHACTVPIHSDMGSPAERSWIYKGRGDLRWLNSGKPHWPQPQKDSRKTKQGPCSQGTETNFQQRTEKRLYGAAKRGDRHTTQTHSCLHWTVSSGPGGTIFPRQAERAATGGFAWSNIHIS